MSPNDNIRRRDALRRDFDIRNIVKELLESEKCTRYMEFDMNKSHSAMVKFQLLGISNKKTHVTRVIQDPDNYFRDPKATLQ